MGNCCSDDDGPLHLEFPAADGPQRGPLPIDQDDSIRSNSDDANQQRQHAAAQQQQDRLAARNQFVAAALARAVAGGGDGAGNGAGGGGMIPVLMGGGDGGGSGGHRRQQQQQRRHHRSRSSPFEGQLNFRRALVMMLLQSIASASAEGQQSTSAAAAADEAGEGGEATGSEGSDANHRHRHDASLARLMYLQDLLEHHPELGGGGGPFGGYNFEEAENLAGGGNTNNPTEPIRPTVSEEQLSSIGSVVSYEDCRRRLKDASCWQPSTPKGESGGGGGDGSGIIVPPEATTATATEKELRAAASSNRTDDATSSCGATTPHCSGLHALHNNNESYVSGTGEPISSSSSSVLVEGRGSASCQEVFPLSSGDKNHGNCNTADDDDDDDKGDTAADRFQHNGSSRGVNSVPSAAAAPAYEQQAQDGVLSAAAAAAAAAQGTMMMAAAAPAAAATTPADVTAMAMDANANFLQPEEHEEGNDDECAICLCEFAKHDQVRLIGKCSHYFHTACIDAWLTTRSSQCPACNQDVLPHQTHQQ